MKIACLIFTIKWMIQACEKLKFSIFMLFFYCFMLNTQNIGKKLQHHFRCWGTVFTRPDLRKQGSLHARKLAETKRACEHLAMQPRACTRTGNDGSACNKADSQRLAVFCLLFKDLIFWNFLQYYLTVLIFWNKI